MDQENRRLLLQRVQDYEMPVEAEELLKKSPPLIIAGVSSVGKNAVADRIPKLSDYQRVITCTTRAPRENEQHGINYWFIDETETARLLEAKAFVEVQLVHGETIYGTTIDAYKSVIDSGHRPLLLVDIYGALKFIKLVPELWAYFLIPPNFEEWMRRFQMRGRVSHLELERRLKTARTEMGIALRSAHVHIIIEEEINKTAKDISQGWTGPGIHARTVEVAERLLEDIRHY